MFANTAYRDSKCDLATQTDVSDILQHNFETEILLRKLVQRHDEIPPFGSSKSFCQCWQRQPVTTTIKILTGYCGTWLKLNTAWLELCCTVEHFCKHLKTNDVSLLTAIYDFKHYK